MEFSQVRWRKASYSNPSGGNCVEVAHLAPTAIAVRDSRDPHGPVLVLASRQWQIFTSQIKAGTLHLH